MFIVFIALAIISAVSLVAGFIWMLVDDGKTRRAQGEEVGKDMIAERLARDDEDGALFKQGTIFRGKASSISVRTGYGFAELKELMASGHWRRALPPLMTMTGLIGLVFFGAVALMMGLEDKLVGGFLVIAMLMSVGRIAYEFIQA